MRTSGPGVQIGAKVELCRQEDNPEQQCAKTEPIGVNGHLGTKTKLRLEWLQGQAKRGDSDQL